MLSHLPGAVSSRVWVLSAAVLVQKSELHSSLATDSLNDAVTWRCADVLPLQYIWRSTAWYFDTSGERPFYLRKANFCHSGIPRNEAFSVWSWHSFVTGRCLDSKLPLLVTVEPGFQVFLGSCWDIQLQVVGTWLAAGWQSAVLALQSCVLPAQWDLLQWTWCGQGLCSSPADTPLSFQEWTKQERY